MHADLTLSVPFIYQVLKLSDIPPSTRHVEVCPWHYSQSSRSRIHVLSVIRESNRCETASKTTSCLCPNQSRLLQNQRRGYPVERRSEILVKSLHHRSQHRKTKKSQRSTQLRIRMSIRVLNRRVLMDGIMLLTTRIR